MAEKKGRGLVGCLVGCLALGLIGAGVAVLGVVLLGGAGAGAAYWVSRDLSRTFDEVAESIEAVPTPVLVPPPAPIDAVEAVPGPDAGNAAAVDGTATDGTTTDGTTTDGTATDGTATDGTATDPTPAPTPAPSGTAQVTPAPAPSPVTAPAPAPVPKPAPAPSPAPLTRPSPAPAPAPVPAPAPMTRASGSGSVTVEGAASVVLIGSDGKRHTLPGSVPVGSYQMEATFSDGVPVNVGKLSVSDGASHVIRCNENMGICRGS